MREEVQSPNISCNAEIILAVFIQFPEETNQLRNGRATILNGKELCTVAFVGGRSSLMIDNLQLTASWSIGVETIPCAFASIQAKNAIANIKKRQKNIFLNTITKTVFQYQFEYLNIENFNFNNLSLHSHYPSLHFRLSRPLREVAPLFSPSLLFIYRFPHRIYITDYGTFTTKVIRLEILSSFRTISSWHEPTSERVDWRDGICISIDNRRYFRCPQ